MNYVIFTPSALRLKKEILDSVSAKADTNGRGIATWQCIETDSGEKVLALRQDNNRIGILFSDGL